MPTTSNSSNGTSGSGSGGTTAKNPFMAGSLLQQRVEVEKQEIEDMKLQLKMREQAGVLGARNMSMNLNLNDSTTNGSFPYQTGGHGRDLSSAGSANSLSSIALSRSLQHQQAPQSSQPAPPKFGGPGTLIEKGEARAAELLQRSKSAGPGLLRPAHVNGSSGAGGGYRRTRSKGRIPTEDQVRYGGPESPRSPDSSPSVPSVPQGPLLQFDDPDAMIQPGLLLSRAKSAKQPFLSNPVNSTHNGYLSRTKNSDNGGRSRGRHGGHGACSQEASQSRTKIKPLVDLGSIKTNQDVIGPGLLTNSNTSAGAASAKSPRRNKPLLEF
ncbi:hypothetical protein BGZ54_007379 [Gamsiella multidivaricata]|nr:hypothetical protein BGZ54_007379 [Gamsiella multidivaricata]